MTRTDPRRPSGSPRKPKASRKQRPQQKTEGDDADGTRLQKVMAAAGAGSRRHCETLILEGRVDVDGKTVKKLGTKVDSATQQIRVDGTVLKTSKAPVYYLVNKPDGVVCTNNDPSGRTRVVDLVPQHDNEHLYTVGRLDLSSEGLILVTNDGDLANHLTHPRYGVEKTYMALVAGKIPTETLDKLRKGVHLAEGIARCTAVSVRKVLPQSTMLEIVLSEGKNREIRRILAKVGHKVLTLKRIAVGDVKLRDLKPGEYRKPTKDELKSLRNSKPTRRKPPRRTTSAGTATEAAGGDAPLIDTRDRSPAHDEPQAPVRSERTTAGDRPERRRGKQQPKGYGTIIGG